MTWTIQIPFRDRSEPLAAAGDLARHLPDPDDRAVVRRLALDAAQDGCQTVGDLLDRLESSGPAQRRLLLDQARAGAGLKPTAAVEAERRVARQPARASARPPRDEAGRAAAAQLSRPTVA